MRVYITNINGQAASSTAQLCQNMVTDIAVSLGYRELGIYAYNMKSDSPSELSKRIDGIIASIRPGDVVIFQSPTWNTTAFDVKLMEKLKLYQIKIIIFIHDVVPLMFAGNEYLMEPTIAYYNQADVIIAPSQAMVDHLRRDGLTVSKVILQEMWDHPSSVPQKEAHFQKLLHFPGSPERFPFVQNWSYPTKLRVYAWQETKLPEAVERYAFRPDQQLLMEMSEGGFGLVWADDDAKSYHQLTCQYKLGTFLAAGIPVIAQKGIAGHRLIEANHLGFLVDDLEEACHIVEHMTEDDYQNLVGSVRQFSPLVRQGYFSRRLLTEAVFQALCH